MNKDNASVVPVGKSSGELVPTPVASTAQVAEVMAPDRMHHAGAVIASPEQLEEVAKNRPFDTFLDGLIAGANLGNTPEERAANIEKFLHGQFVRLAPTGLSFKLDANNSQAIRTVIDRYQNANMGGQARAFESQSGIMSRVMKAFLHLESVGKLNSGCMIPGQNLPDLFMAAPVWYSNDMRFTLDLCNELVGSTPFAAMFQLYNNSDSNRPLHEFDSDVDIMPLDALAEIELGNSVFDDVVIATPYHDLATQNWMTGRIGPRRQPDPYLFGFIRGFPFVFMLSRWSGSGTFPLYPDMLSMTMSHLDTNLPVIQRIREGLWRNAANGWMQQNQFPISAYVEKAIAAFREGKLFEYLRTGPAEPMKTN